VLEGGPSDLAYIRAEGCRAADGVYRFGADEQIEFGAQRAERIVAGSAEPGFRPTVGLAQAIRMLDDALRLGISFASAIGRHMRSSLRKPAKADNDMRNTGRMALGSGKNERAS